MQTSYRKPMNFTWEAAKGAETSFKDLVKTYQQLSETTTPVDPQKISGGAVYFFKTFAQKLSEDLNITGALGDMWYMLRSNDIPDAEKKYLLDRFDAVMGLNLAGQQIVEAAIPEDVQELASQRAQAREEKDFKKSDYLRKKIEEMGYIVEDTSEGFALKKNKYLLT